MNNAVNGTLDDEQLLAALHDALRGDAAVPAGLVARLQAGVRSARIGVDRFTVGERVVLGTLLFTAIAYVGGGAGITVGGLVALAYGASLNTVALNR